MSVLTSCICLPSEYKHQRLFTASLSQVKANSQIWRNSFHCIQMIRNKTKERENTNIITVELLLCDTSILGTLLKTVPTIFASEGTPTCIQGTFFIAPDDVPLINTDSIDNKSLRNTF